MPGKVDPIRWSPFFPQFSICLSNDEWIKSRMDNIGQHENIFACKWCWTTKHITIESTAKEPECKKKTQSKKILYKHYNLFNFFRFFFFACTQKTSKIILLKWFSGCFFLCLARLLLLVVFVVSFRCLNVNDWFILCDIYFNLIMPSLLLSLHSALIAFIQWQQHIFTIFCRFIFYSIEFFFLLQSIVSRTIDRDKQQNEIPLFCVVYFHNAIFRA